VSDPKTLYVRYRNHRQEVLCDECLRDLDVSIRETEGLLTKQAIDACKLTLDGQIVPLLRATCARCWAEFSYEELPEGSSWPKSSPR
jgi:hypothetical protein